MGKLPLRPLAVARQNRSDALPAKLRAEVYDPQPVAYSLELCHPRDFARYSSRRTCSWTRIARERNIALSPYQRSRDSHNQIPDLGTRAFLRLAKRCIGGAAPEFDYSYSRNSRFESLYRALFRHLSR